MVYNICYITYAILYNICDITYAILCYSHIYKCYLCLYITLYDIMLNTSVIFQSYIVTKYHDCYLPFRDVE